MALLRLAQGDKDAAAAAIRRVTAEATERPKRAGLLPAYVEIMLAVGDAEEARGACREREEIATGYESDMLTAMAAQARGAVALAAGDAPAALVALRDACRLWRELEAPYEGACARVWVGLACRAVGDDDAAAMEDEAHKVGLRIAHHAGVEETNAWDDIKFGTTSIEHWYGIPDAALETGVQNFPAGYNYNDEGDRFRYGGRL
jgi:ATP/maltotriose-dependent transcriptional regulator MalT